MTRLNLRMKPDCRWVSMILSFSSTTGSRISRLFCLIYYEEIAFKVSLDSRFFSLAILCLTLLSDVSLNLLLLVIYCKCDEDVELVRHFFLFLLLLEILIALLKTILKSHWLEYIYVCVFPFFSYLTIDIPAWWTLKTVTQSWAFDLQSADDTRYFETLWLPRLAFFDIAQKDIPVNLLFTFLY